MEGDKDGESHLFFLFFQVMYYSYEPVNDSFGFGSSETSPSAKGPVAALPPMSGDFSTLIYKLLQNKTSGVWGKRFSKEFENFHKMTAPPDVSSRAAALPFVEKSM